MATQRIKQFAAPRGQVWSQCEKKNRYEDEIEAQRIINARRRSGEGDSLRYYECQFCDGFHITKKGKL